MQNQEFQFLGVECNVTWDNLLYELQWWLKQQKREDWDNKETGLNNEVDLDRTLLILLAVSSLFYACSILNCLFL